MDSKWTGTISTSFEAYCCNSCYSPPISIAKYRNNAGNLPSTIAISIRAITHHGTVVSVAGSIFGGSGRIAGVTIAAPVVICIVTIISPIVAMPVWTLTDAATCQCRQGKTSDCNHQDSLDSHFQRFGFHRFTIPLTNSCFQVQPKNFL